MYSDFYDLLLELVGEEEFEVTFVKKNKKLRTMKCTLTDFTERLDYGLLTVVENGQLRSVNINTLIRIKFNDIILERKGDKWV